MKPGDRVATLAEPGGAPWFGAFFGMEGRLAVVCYDRYPGARHHIPLEDIRSVRPGEEARRGGAIADPDDEC